MLTRSFFRFPLIAPRISLAGGGSGLLLLAAAAVAAPPKVAQLFPAGGKAGETVTARITGKLDAWPPGLDVLGDGLDVRPTEKKGELLIRIDADASPGVRWIRVHDAEGAAAPRPFCVGTLPEEVEKEPNDVPAQAQEVAAAGQTVNGRLERAGDVDCYRVKLEQGATLVAAIQAAERLGSPMDGVLQVLTRDGFVLDQNDDEGGFDPRLVFQAPAGAEYCLRVFAFPSEPNSTIAFAGGEAYVYRLDVTTSGYVERAEPLAARAHATAPVRLRGSILAKDATAAVTCETTVLPGWAEAFQRGVAGSAILKILPCDVFLEPSDPFGELVPALQPPFAVSAAFESPGDADVWSVSGKPGQRVKLAAESRRFGLPADAMLIVTGADGKLLGEADDAGNNRDPEQIVTLPADGVCSVTVRELLGRGGPRFAYLLTGMVPEPDFALTVAADSFVLDGDKPLELTVGVDRRESFRDEIEVEVTGLPPGLEAPRVKCPGEGDASRQVKLSIARGAHADGWRGPIGVAGKSLGAPTLLREARAPLSGGHASTARLWLTVIARAAPKP
jgi:hypothetical protein